MIDGKITVIELFAGIGAQHLALEQLHQDFGLEYEILGISEIDKHAIQGYNAIHGDTFNFGDISKIDHLPKATLWTYSFPCVAGDTLVETIEGWKEIKDVKIGDMVRTDVGYKRVTNSAQTGVKPVMSIKPSCATEILCTDYHPIFARKKERKYLGNHYENGRRRYERVFSEPSFIAANELTKDYYVGFPINEEKTIPEWDGFSFNRGKKEFHKNELSEYLTEPKFWWTVGRYLADGWTRDGRVILAFGKDKEQDVENLFSNRYSISKEGSVEKIHITIKEFQLFCEQFGVGAINKHIPEKYKSLPKELAKAMLDGYMSGDGYKRGEYEKASTISKTLALDLVQLIAYVYGTVGRIHFTKKRATHTIEGRTVNQHDSYEVVFKTTKSKFDKSFCENGWIWSSITKIGPLSEESIPVFDITVEDAHRFIANGIMVKNCQDISVAGQQKGFDKTESLEDRTRSGLLWEVERLLLDAQERGVLPDFLLMENVDAIVNKKNLPNFNKWLDALDRLGYHTDWQILNAKDFGVPQNRKRVFALSTLTKNAYTFPEPFPLDRCLKDVLEDDVPESFYIKEERLQKYQSFNRGGQNGN